VAGGGGGRSSTGLGSIEVVLGGGRLGGRSSLGGGSVEEGWGGGGRGGRGLETRFGVLGDGRRRSGSRGFGLGRREKRLEEVSDVARMEETKIKMNEQMLGTSATTISGPEAEEEQLAESERKSKARLVSSRVLLDAPFPRSTVDPSSPFSSISPSP